jgi:hypothetical protein
MKEIMAPESIIAWTGREEPSKNRMTGIVIGIEAETEETGEEL